MTHRERFIRSLTGGTVDRSFRRELGAWPATVKRWKSEGMPADADLQTYFNFDPLVSIPIKSGYTTSPYYPDIPEVTIDETDEYRIYVDGDGITKKVLKVDADTSMPQFMKFPMADPSVWPKMREYLNPADAASRIGDVESLQKACSDPDIPNELQMCGAYGHPRNLLGEEGLSYLVYDDSVMLEEILDNWLELYVELIRKVTEVIRVDTILIWEDMCFKSGPLISPEHFRQYMLPRYKDFIVEARRCGVEAITVDTDGDCWKMIPIFLEAGADAMLPFEVQAGMDIREVRKEYGTDQLGIFGGINKRALAIDKEAIRTEVDRIMPAMLSAGRYVPSLDHTAPVDVSLENYQYYLECLREYEKE